VKYSEKQIEDLLSGIYDDKINVENLPEDLYFAIAEHLKEGLFKGFGGDLAEFGGKDYALLNELRENVYMFSGAKTYQEVREMGALLADSENFKDFRDKALEVYGTYNKNWLETEYNTAIGQGMQANQWNEIEKNKSDFPFLRYSAVIDDRTSDICEPINGVILPVDDPFWDEYTPLNHFNCRCVLEQIDKFEDVNVTPKGDIDTLKENLNNTVSDVFKMNVGKDGYVFSPEHPYFEVAPKDRDLARENFNLPIPEAPAPKEMEFTPAKTIKEAKEKIAELINRNANYNVEKIRVASELTLEQMNQNYKTVDSLFNEYKVSEVPTRNKPINVSFNSGKGFYGKVSFNYKYDLSEFSIKDINFGSRSDLTNSRKYDPKFLGGQRFKSRVDDKNLNIATVVHEFGHVLAMSEQTMFKNCPKYLQDFYLELKSVRTEYSNELLGYNKLRDMAAINEISIGRYAATNIDEFLAEGFTEYKLSSEPSKYAKKIGTLIDKYFKK